MLTCRSAVGCTTPFSFRSRINPGYDIKIFKLSWQTGNSPANQVEGMIVLDSWSRTPSTFRKMGHERPFVL